jgi:2-phospho-L-lactate guanylyltransferase
MLYAVVPVKTLVRAKSRLAPALSFTQRLLLARRFLHDTLALLEQHPGAHRTIVVSADPSVLRLARTKGMIALAQTARGGINRAVALGCALAKRYGASSVVVIPTDLPHLTVDSLKTFARPGSRPTIRLAPDRHGSGTNALYLQPVRPGFARFGEQSLKSHRTAALICGSDAQLVLTDMLAFDVDVPADLLPPVS